MIEYECIDTIFKVDNCSKCGIRPFVELVKGNFAYMYRVKCYNCNSIGMLDNNVSKAVRLWNMMQIGISLANEGKGNK